jgi:hypothetical protein
MLPRAFAVFAAALLASTAACAEEATTSFGDFLAQYRCPVVDRLEQIYNAAPHSHPQNLFLIVYFAARPHDYVQCVFDPLTYMFCEAAAGSTTMSPASHGPAICPRAPSPRSPASDFRLTTRREIFGSASK